MAAPSILSPGAKVGGKYEVVEVLGFGGMGVVYKIREQVGAVSRIRALKTVLPQYANDAAIVARFRQEAEKMCMLEHENIVPVLSYSEEGEFPYLVMPFIEGQTLKEYVASHVAEHGRGLPLAEAMEIGLEVVRGLEVAHRFVHPETHRPQPMVHRDIKPGNIMVRVEHQGGERRLKVLLMDFGIAKVLSDEDSGHTLTEVIGTVKYASPEQIRRQKDIDPRADIYSLGVVLFEIYAGRHLFAGLPEHTVLMRMMQHDVKDHEIDFPAEAPERFRQLITRCVAVERERRFPNVGEIRALMRRILDEDSERVKTEAQHAREFAHSERQRAVDRGAGEFAATALAEADARVAEGEAALADRRYPQAVAVLRAAAEVFARAADEAAAGRERARLAAARSDLSALKASAVAAEAERLAAAQVAAANHAAELYEKAMAAGDFTGASRALAQAQRAWREAEARAREEIARRDTDAAFASLDEALLTSRTDLMRIPAGLRAAAGAAELETLEAKAKAARAAAATDSAAALPTAKELRAALSRLGEARAKSLADAAAEREARFAARLAATDSSGDVTLAAEMHAEVVALGTAARQHRAGGLYAEAAGEYDRALGALDALDKEISARRIERDRQLEAAERNRRAEPAARAARTALEEARARILALEPLHGAERIRSEAIAKSAAEAESDFGAGELAAAAPRLRRAADDLIALAAEVASRLERERQSARLAELRSTATRWSQELGDLGRAVTDSAEARRLLATLGASEEHASAGDLAAAIRILEGSVPKLGEFVAAKRAEQERERAEAEARAARERAAQSRERARALGERATGSPEFAAATADLDSADQALGASDFAECAERSSQAARSFEALVLEVERVEREERLAALRERRRVLDERLGALPPSKAAQRARKPIGRSIAKLDRALSSDEEAEAVRLASEIERWIDALAGGHATDAFESKTLLPWPMGAAIGGAALALVAVLWLILGSRTEGPEIVAGGGRPVATERAVPTRLAPTPEPAATAEPPPRPTAAPPTPNLAPTAAPPTPPRAEPSPIPRPSLPPLALASARPTAKSITLRAGSQARFEASLENDADAVLQWRLGGDAVGQGESFVLGKALSEAPGTKKLEVVATRGHEHVTLRSWDVEIEAPPIGFARLDPPTASLERQPGSRVSFRAPVKNTDTEKLSFLWQVNGETARGIEGPNYDFQPQGPGEYLVAVRATAPWGASIANTWKLSVRPPPTPSIVEEPKSPVEDSKATAREWIQAYCNAFQTKDTDALIALGHLTSQGEASRLRDALAAMNDLRVSCSNPSVRVSGDQAVVSFDRTDHWTDPRGSEMERALPRITKTLRRSNGRWVAVP